MSVAVPPRFDLQSYAKRRGFPIVFATIETSYVELGSGGFGIVYAISPTKVTKQFRSMDDHEQMKRELEMSRFLHPNVIQCFGVIVHREAGILLERGGGELFDVIANRGPLDDDRLDAFAFDLISAATFLHGQQPPIYHLDIKLENLLVCSVSGYGESLKLADFGLSHCDDWEDDTDRFGSQSPTPKMCGSRSYMPHGSLALRQAFLPFRDGWAIGCALFVMAYGRMLYDVPTDEAYKRLWTKIQTNSPITFAALFNFPPRFIEPVLAKLLAETPQSLQSLHPMFFSSLYQLALPTDAPSRQEPSRPRHS